MRIFSIHGYNGSAHNSVYNALTDCGYDVYAPQIDYNAKSPREILYWLFGEYAKSECNAVVGTSVGGYFAALFCAVSGCHTLLINPCLMPFVVLPGLGYTNADGILEFSHMFSTLAKLYNNRVSTIIGLDDEIIKEHTYTKILLGNERYYEIKDGKHSGATLPLREIIKQHGEEIFGEEE